MKKYVSIIFTLFVVFSVHSQSADIITDILETEQATFGQVCYISAVEQGLIDEKDDYEKAVEALALNELIPDVVDASLPVPLSDAAFVLSHIWDIKGSLMYSITKGSPRYCFKLFKADRIIPATAEPHDYISGATLLNIYNECVSVYGNYDVQAVSMEAE